MYDLPELQLLRAGLDALTIRGADAKYIADLQTRLEQEILKLSNSQQEKSPAKK